MSAAKNQSLGAPPPPELPLPEPDEELDELVPLDELLLELDDEPLELELLEELELEDELLDDDEDPATMRKSVSTLYAAIPVAPETLVVLNPPTRVA